MALVHNLMARGLNSIYLQAPYVQPKDERSFLRYIRHWHNLLEVHHTGEEEGFFDDVEEMAGEKGIMAANVNQHHLFHDAEREFIAYVDACLAKTQTYDGKKVVKMIDAFGPVLVQHLADEIPTLLGLKKYGEKMRPVVERFDKEGEKNMVSEHVLFFFFFFPSFSSFCLSLSCIYGGFLLDPDALSRKELKLTRIFFPDLQKALGMEGLCIAFSDLDYEFEGGIWHAFPPAPGFVVFLQQKVFSWIWSDQWKFGSCDRNGRLKPLYAVPQDKRT
jgi:hemerythrin-like domain-containing protein